MSWFGGRFMAITSAVLVAGLMTALPARAEDWIPVADTPEPTVTLAPLPQGWTLGGSNAAEYAAGTCSGESWGGQASGALISTGFNFAGSAHLARSIDAAGYRGQRVRLTAKMKTVNVRSGASLWLNTTGTVPADMPVQVQGSADWRTVSVVTEIPADARQISFGAWMTGRGKVFVNGIQIEVIQPESVAQGGGLSFGG
jgi:hypothetical protein